ncbi:MAG: hypothetical protein RL701_7121 [Pseudomonadota bacterium]|jgi:nucleotide-binding universal stress UspA family protein
MLAVQRPYVILAALSFDKAGMCALREAVNSARYRPNAELHIVHVVPVRRLMPLAADEKHHNVEIMRGELQQYVDQLELDQTMKVTAHLRYGMPSDCILQTARDLDADMIVIGTRLGKRIEKLLLGSTANRVLRRAERPVLLAMPKGPSAAASTSTIEPACPDCVAAREDSAGRDTWCARHSRPRVTMHVYEPSEQKSPALMR